MELGIVRSIDWRAKMAPEAVTVERFLEIAAEAVVAADRGRRARVRPVLRQSGTIRDDMLLFWFLLFS